MAGSVYLTLESTLNGGCTPVLDSILITIDSGIFVNAGPPQTTCSNLPDITLAGAVMWGVNTGIWSTSGTGPFTPSATDLGALYSPTPADTATGSVLLTLTTTGMNCAAVSDNISLTILPGIYVNAGVDQSVCGNNRVATIAGVVASATGGKWFTPDGTGVFADSSALVTTYTPSDADTLAGLVTLVLTSTGNGACAEVKDTMILTIDQIPFVTAGFDDTLCANNDTVYLSGSISGGSTTGIWVALGTGFFSPSDTDLTALYVPSVADTVAGFVDLLLVSTNNFSNCVAETDTIRIFITPSPQPLAGVDQTVCANNADATLAGDVQAGASTGVWSTLTSGTFAPNDSDLNAVYSPDTADTAAGFATLILTTTNNGNCLPVSDTLFVIITDQPQADAGPDQGLCSDNAIATLIGSVTNATGMVWRTIDGTGTFDDTTSAVALYSASSADTAAGCITITLTTTGVGTCIPVTDSMTLCFNPSSIFVTAISASPSVCANNADINVLGTVGGGTTTGQWISLGTGSFNDPNQLNALYSPSDSDTLVGSVILVLASTNNGQCNPVTDTVFVTIVPAPVVDAGGPQTICSNTQAPLNGLVYNNTITGMWSSSGSGTFTPNDSDLNATYIPSPSDTLLGSVTIILATTNNGFCNQEFDNMVLTLSPTPQVDAGPDQIVCAEFSFADLAGSVNGVTNTGKWTTSGSGTFTPNDSDLFATYLLSVQDTIDTFITIILTSSNNGICAPVTDSMLVTVTFQTPQVLAGNDITVCGNNSNVALAGSVSFGTTTGLWTTSGSGTFLPNPTSLIGTYVPSAADKDSGIVQLTLAATNSCPITDVFDVIVTPSPNANAGSDTALCIGINTITLNGSVTGGATTGIWTTLGTGTFDDDTLMTATYTMSPGDSIAGGATLLLTSTNVAVLCFPDTDSIVVSLTTLPVPNAGGDDTACANAPYVLGGVVTGGASTGIWTTLGNGTFDSLASSTTNLNGTYTFSPAEALDTTGVGVQLVLTTTNACINFSDTMTLYPTEKPNVDAGFDVIVCANNDTVPLFGVVNIVTTTGQWSAPTGDGVFLPNDSALNGIYIPGPGDATNGIVYLVLTSTNNKNCLPVTDTLAVTISPDPIVDAGVDVNQCLSNPDVNLLGSVSGGASTGIWNIIKGSGTFVPNTITLTAQYIPTATDLDSGVTLVLNSTNQGLCIPEFDTLDIIWTVDPTVDAGPDLSACVDTSGIPLAGVVGGG
ncbi:MAG: hypothetical protein JKX73_09945, partial [Flavobacteriales bacterium]|nr:hypothetical protein [Flavobacteriales bacterium]